MSRSPALPSEALAKRPPTAAAMPATPLTAADSPTLRAYAQTLTWTFLAIAVCALGYAIEKYVFLRGFSLPLPGLTLEWRALTPLADDAPYRMFKNPAELPMRLFGLPHFIVGLLFMLSSKRMRGVRSFAWLIGLTALGGAFCMLFARFGGTDSPYMLLVFYFYFLIHGFRDEAFFYRAYGDMPKDQLATHSRIVVVLQGVLLGLLISLLLPAYMLYGRMHPERPEYQAPALDQLFPAQWPFLLRFVAMLAPMLIVALLALTWIARQFPDGLRGLWRVHRPILIVFFGSTALILLALGSGPWTFNAVVLMHFVGWYLFGRHSLAKHAAAPAPAAPPTIAPAGSVGHAGLAAANAARASTPPAPRTGLWLWMRTTRPGFTFLHLGLAAIVIVLVALSNYAFGKQDVLEQIVGSKVFFYWTIMHVTLSFFPR